MIGQENITFQKPSQEILQLADYERAPSVSLSSNKEWMVLMYRNTYKTLQDLNQEEMRLGGLRINPITNISSTTTFINNIKVKKVSDKIESDVKGFLQMQILAICHGLQMKVKWLLRILQRTETSYGF